ncbi:MAG: XRE family transcriptional regulator [Clostridia bacterium]|nr:XRE family transcriptional regulator [Clostridia bacterium]NCC43734.1 XRE family transcriptional regulator [Clostridia bacterium]
MGEINIAKRLIEERHKKKITQEGLASYIGVSKAAVSKWESGASFPDITYLPQLAAYFNISIDELMGYEPQMTKEDIRKKYNELKKRFAEEPFDAVLQVCEDLIKKYYSCFPFLLQMTVLLLNHAVLAKEPGKIYEKAQELAQRVRTMSDDVNDAKEAATLEATIYLITGAPMKALDLMDEELRPMSQDIELRAQIYQSMGDMQKAREAYQIGMYQHLLLLIGGAAPYMMLYKDEYDRVMEIIDRTLQVVDIFKTDFLHPNATASIYITCAQIFCIHGENDKALDMLEKYVDLCKERFFPFTLHGDEYFDQLDEWFVGFDIGNGAPRSEKLIRESMLQVLKDNPFFTNIKDDVRYKNMIKKLEAVRDGGPKSEKKLS